MWQLVQKEIRRAQENEKACEPAPAPAPQPAPAAGETPARTAGDIPNTAAEATGVETAQEPAPAPAPEPAAVGTPEANTSAPMTNADAVKALERLGVTASKPGDGRMFTKFGDVRFPFGSMTGVGGVSVRRPAGEEPLAVVPGLVGSINGTRVVVLACLYVGLRKQRKAANYATSVRWWRQ